MVGSKLSAIFHTVRVIGLLALISYMIVVLCTWMYANSIGSIYFKAGEPLLHIKYSEWILGFVGIIVATHYLRRELGFGPKG